VAITLGGKHETAHRHVEMANRNSRKIKVTWFMYFWHLPFDVKGAMSRITHLEKIGELFFFQVCHS